MKKLYLLVTLILLHSCFLYAGVFEDLNKSLDKALLDSPKAAKLICSEKIKNHILFFGASYSPIKIRKLFLEFETKRKEYLGNLLDISHFNTKGEKSPLIRDISDQGYTGATFDQAFYQALVGMFNSDLIELIHLKSFYVNAVFASSTFEAELERCQSFFGYSIPNMYDDILWHTRIRNYAGYTSGQVATVLTGYGVASKVISLLPKAGRALFIGGSGIISGIYAYNISTPIIKNAKEIKYAAKNATAYNSTDLTDRRNWAEIYHKIYRLRDAAVALNNSTTDAETHINKNKFNIVLMELEKSRALLELIKKKYLVALDANQLSDQQNIDYQVLSFALIQIHIAIMQDKSDEESEKL